MFSMYKALYKCTGWWIDDDDDRVSSPFAVTLKIAGTGAWSPWSLRWCRSPAFIAIPVPVQPSDGTIFNARCVITIKQTCFSSSNQSLTLALLTCTRWRV